MEKNTVGDLEDPMILWQCPWVRAAVVRFPLVCFVVREGRDADVKSVIALTLTN